MPSLGLPEPVCVERPRHDVIQYVVRQIVFVTPYCDRVRNCSAARVSVPLHQSDRAQLAVFDLVQRFYRDPLFLGQFPQVRSERIKVRLALTNERADRGCGGPTALARNAGDGETHQFARKVRHAKQVIFNRKRKILGKRRAPVSRRLVTGSWNAQCMRREGGTTETHGRAGFIG